MNAATFVAVGNAKNPFPRMLDAIKACLTHLPQPLLVQHGTTAFREAACICRSFVNMNEFDEYIVQAQLLIVHGGAGSVIHAIRAGKTPIVIPRLAKYGEIIDDHQLEFARALHRDGKVLLLEESGNLLEAVHKVLSHEVVPAITRPTPSLLTLVTTVLRDCAKTVPQ
jgi:UDP-N-acetylglucosamine transferase subunit ALG13